MYRLRLQTGSTMYGVYVPIGTYTHPSAYVTIVVTHSPKLSILDTLSMLSHLSLIPNYFRSAGASRYFSHGISRKCTPVIMMDPLRNSCRVPRPFSHLSYLRELPKSCGNYRGDISVQGYHIFLLIFPQRPQIIQNCP